MPLVMFCGGPGSGKSWRCRQLADYLTQKGAKVVVLDESTVSQEPLSVTYENDAAEKRLRGALRAVVDRSLTRDTFVLLDWLNYIKGYRYELYCVARMLGTPHAVVYCLADESKAAALSAEKYGSEKLAMDLWRRLEIPNGSARWDRPLFEVPEGADCPSQQIAEALGVQVDGPVKSKDAAVAGALQSTRQMPLTQAAYVPELSRITLEVVTTIAQSLVGVAPGARLSLEPLSKRTFEVRMGSSVTALHAHRRAFLRLASLDTARPPLDGVADAFVDYLNAQR